MGERALVAATLLVLSVLHFAHSRHLLPPTMRELSLDEASTYHIATHPLGELVRLAVESHSQPPLYYLILHFILPLGDSELVLRGVNWLFVLALVWVVVLGMRELSLLARGMFGLILVTSHYAYRLMIVRPYALCILTSFLASLLLLRALEAPQRKRLLVGYGIALAAALGSAAFNAWLLVAHGLVLAAAFLGLARREGARAALRRLGWLFGVLGLVGAAYFPYVLHVREHAASRGSPSLLSSLAAIWSPHRYAWFVRSMAGDGWAAYLLLVPIALGAWRFRGTAALLWLAVGLGQPLFTVMFMAGRGSAQPRYVSPAFPVLVLLVVAGIEQVVLWLLRSLRWQQRLAFVPMGFACIAAALHTKELMARGGPDPRDVNWQRLSQELSRVKGQKVVFFRVGINAQMPAYYSRHDQSVEYVLPSPLGDNRANKSIASRALIGRGIREHPRARCFVYVKDARRGKRGKDLYDKVFTRKMAELGYVASFTVKSGKVRNKSHDSYSAHGFCRH